MIQSALTLTSFTQFWCLSACLVCSWKYCGEHFNVNQKDKNKMNTKTRVLIHWQNYFCLKSNFVTENQTCTLYLHLSCDLHWQHCHHWKWSWAFFVSNNIWSFSFKPRTWVLSNTSWVLKYPNLLLALSLVKANMLFTFLRKQDWLIANFDMIIVIDPNVKLNPGQEEWKEPRKILAPSLTTLQ